MFEGIIIISLRIKIASFFTQLPLMYSRLEISPEKKSLTQILVLLSALCGSHRVNIN